MVGSGKGQRGAMAEGTEGCQQSYIWRMEVEKDWCLSRSGLKPIAF